MGKVAYVYLITCISTGDFYIGKSLNPEARFYAHLTYASKGTTPLYRAIIKYGKESFKLSILEECDSESSAYLAETKWIKEFRNNGKSLFNLNDGGEGNFSPSEETRLRMSKAQKGKIISEEQREKIANKLKGSRLTPETLEKISQKLRGRKHSDEALKKIAEGAKRRSQNPIWIEKNREALRETHRKLKESGRLSEIAKKSGLAKRKYTDEDALKVYAEYEAGKKIVDIMNENPFSTGTLYRMFARAKEIINSKII